jgi:predicted dinucleotide-utilizing enzyme
MARKSKEKRLRIVLIGYGAISQMLFDVFKEKKPPIDIVGVLVRPGRAKATQKAVGRKVAVVEDLKSLLKLKPDVVVEAASQQAVRDWGETILKKGFDLMVIATGAYGDPKLWKRHKAAAAGSGARLRLPSGAIAGLDGLLAMRLGKLERVKYTSIKPPHAWSGTPAETDFDLPSIKEPTVIFQGTPADLSEERQSRGHRGAVRRGTGKHRHRAGRRPHPAARHQCQPPGGGERFRRAAARAAGQGDAGQSQDRRADRAHHGRRPDEDGARQRLVSWERPSPLSSAKDLMAMATSAPLKRR